MVVKTHSTTRPQHGPNGSAQRGRFQTPSEAKASQEPSLIPGA
jgi:hypothetical protein